MLKELDDIPWVGLQHAYGSAADVPRQLRALLSSDEGERKNAMDALYPSICHQGTVYDATPPAMRFLIELLGDASVPGRDPIAALVASIICGRGAHPTAPRTLINPFTKEPMTIAAGSEEELAKDRAIVAEVRRSGTGALPLLLPYLTHPDAYLRILVVQALANYRSEGDHLVPRLREMLAVEQDEEVCDAIRVAIPELSGVERSA